MLPGSLLTGGGSQEVRTISEEEGERFVFKSDSVSVKITMRSSSKSKRRKTQREATHERRQGDPVFEEESSEIVFRNTESPAARMSPVPRSPLVSPVGSTDLQYEDVLDMVQTLHKELGLITLDYDKIRTVCSKLLKDNQARDRAIGDLT